MDWIIEKLKSKIEDVVDHSLWSLYESRMPVDNPRDPLNIMNMRLDWKKHWEGMFQRVEDLLRQEIKPYEEAITSLTPRGSEFVGDPEYCSHHIKNRHDQLWENLKKEVGKRKAAQKETIEFSNWLLQNYQPMTSVSPEGHPQRMWFSGHIGDPGHTTEDLYQRWKEG
jgi:hypothetical protein